MYIHIHIYTLSHLFRPPAPLLREERFILPFQSIILEGDEVAHDSMMAAAEYQSQLRPRDVKLKPFLPKRKAFHPCTNP